MRKVYCIGELLIDFISKDTTNKLEEVNTFDKKAGGAPANVAVAISRLGGDACFLGQVGNDAFGLYLKNRLKENSVNIDNIIEKGNTTLAFVTLDSEGERDFHFVRGGDKEYYIDINKLKIEENSIIHFGSATAFLGGELRESYINLFNYAKENNIYTSFDPNFRSALVTDDKIEEFKSDAWHFIREANLVKLSSEEALLLTGANSIEDSLDMLFNEKIETLVITLGKKGAFLFKNGQYVKISTIKVEQVDATGAGDAFIGALLYKLSEQNELKNLSTNDFISFIKFSNKVGAIATTSYGAMEALPFKKDLEKVF